MLSLLWQICDIIGQIFIVATGQILKNNLNIWLHCVRVSMTSMTLLPPSFQLWKLAFRPIIPSQPSHVCAAEFYSKAILKLTFILNFFFSLSFSIHVKIAKTCFQFFHFWWLVSNLFHLFSSFTVNNVHPVYSAGIRTHNLWNVSLLP